MEASTALPGRAVIDPRGRIGIITDEARKSGGSKGKIGVMFIGAPYATLEAPEDLTVVTLEVRS